MSEENTKKDNNSNKKTKKKMSVLAKILFGLAGAIVLMVIIVVCYILHLLSLPEIVPNDGTSGTSVSTSTSSSIISTAPTTDNSIGTGDVTNPTTETTSVTETTEDLSHLPEYTLPSTSEGETIAKKEVELRTDKNVYNIILLGIDPLDGLSDSMIVATINKNDDTIRLTSFMRDMFIEDIPGFKPNRINTVYNNGGMKLLNQVFKENFGIELHGFAAVDYNILVEVVDALGGIELYINEEEAEFLKTSNYIEPEEHRTLIPGATQQLNGYQVAGFCRLRYVNRGGESNDFARTRRQRDVLIAIYEKFRDSDITTLLGLLEKVLPLVKTDLDKGEMVSMATKAISCLNNDIRQLRVPVAKSWDYYKYIPEGKVDYLAVISWDMEKNVDAIHEFMFESEEE